jgi:alpha/beta superfamily hydrolase
VAIVDLPYRAARESHPYDTPSGLPGTLVVQGERDDRVPLTEVRDRSRLEGQPVIVVPRADHFFKGRLAVLRPLITEHPGAIVERAK